MSLRGGEEGLQGPRSWAISVTEHICSQHREGQTLGAGLECRGPGGWGNCCFTPSGSLEAPAVPFGEGGAAHSRVHGVEETGPWW